MISKESLPHEQVYADIQGFTVAGGTIPSHIYVTSQRPDLVVIWESIKQMLMIELTVPFETNTNAAHTRKLDRYKELVAEVRNNGYSVTYHAIEIGARGQINRDNTNRLKWVLRKCSVPLRPNSFFQTISRYAVVSSFVIFNARKESQWKDVEYLDL